MSTMLIMILFTLFTCLRYCLLETGAIPLHSVLSSLIVLPHLHTSTGASFPYELMPFVFFFSCYKQTSRCFAMRESLFRNASKFDSWRAALFNIVGVHGKLDCLTPDAASLFTTLWDCLVSSRDGWRDWDKRIKVIVILLHCRTAAVGHYLTDALLLVLCSFVGLFLLQFVHVLSAWIIILLQNWRRQSVKAPICKMIHEKWGKTSYVHF